MEVTSLADRPDLGEAFYAPELDPGPTFAYHDPVGVELWPRLDVAISHDFAVLYAPVAPTRNSDYPLIEMQDYIAWTLADGRSPLDPWLRVHWKLGGRVLHVCSRSGPLYRTQRLGPARNPLSPAAGGRPSD